MLHIWPDDEFPKSLNMDFHKKKIEISSILSVNSSSLFNTVRERYMRINTDFIKSILVNKSWTNWSRPNRIWTAYLGNIVCLFNQVLSICHTCTNASSKFFVFKFIKSLTIYFNLSLLKGETANDLPLFCLLSQ